MVIVRIVKQIRNVKDVLLWLDLQRLLYDGQPCSLYVVRLAEVGTAASVPLLLHIKDSNPLMHLN